MLNEVAPSASEALDARDMARLVEGHDDALDSLMARHADKLFHYLLRSLQNHEDATDLAQEVFVKVYQNRAKFDPRQKFWTWLYTIATNLVRDRFRWRSRHRQISLEAENASTGTDLRANLPEEHPSPAESLQMSERGEIVRRAVARLPEDLRLPLILAEYEGLSHAEIGEVLRCTPKAVENRIYRARQQLRASLRTLLAPV
jgi:RNA polymerase sigma-70 factor, ECF subfamily